MNFSNLPRLHRLELSDNIAAMDDPRWLRLITVGLVLAALAVGYFLLTGKFSSNSLTKQSSPSPSVLGQNAQIALTPTPTPASALDRQTASSAYNRIVNRTQGGTQVLPKTGFPAGLVIVFSVSAIISGWGLRKYPN